MGIGVRELLGCTFLLVLSLLLTILACTVIPDHNAWPLLPWLFYFFVPIPAVACLRKQNDSLFNSESDVRGVLHNLGLFFVGVFAASGPCMIFVQYHTDMTTLVAMFMSLGSTILLAAAGGVLAWSSRPRQDDW